MTEQETVGEQQWYVTAPASPESYAQFRVYDGPMSREEALRESSRRGERYSATREGVVSVAKVVDRRE